MTFLRTAATSAVIAALAIGMSTMPVFAKSKADLIADGFSCEVTSAGFITCTKTGHKDWWCSGDTCEESLKTVGPKGPTKPKLDLHANLANLLAH